MRALLVALALAGGGGADEPGVLAYTRIDRDGAQVWRMRADGGERVLLARDARDPAWSPDGRRLAFTRGGAIWTMEAGGGDQRRLTEGVSTNDYGPAWSPDGRSLAFTRIGAAGGAIAHSIWVMGADGSSAQSIVNGGTTIRVSGPAWSPDGQLIAFARAILDARRETSDSAIYSVRTDGGEPRRLSAPGSIGDAPAWSPDGRRIAYLARGDRNGRSCFDQCTSHAEIHLMSADGGSTLRLTRTRSDEGRPSWGDDGATIVFDGQPPGKDVSSVVALAIESGCTAAIRVATGRSESFRDLAWQPGSGTSRLPCDPPLAPARATFVGIAPDAVRARIRGGRAAERALLRRLLAGLGRGAGVEALHLGRPPAGRAGATRAIWLRFEFAARSISNRAATVRPIWDAGLVADAYQRAAAAGLAPRPLLGHAVHFAAGTTTTSTQARRRKDTNAPRPNDPLPVSLIASEVTAATLPRGVRIETLRFVRHHDQSAVRLVLRIGDPTSFRSFNELFGATLGRLQLDQGGLVEFRDRCGKLVAAIATGVDGAPGRLGVAPGWVCPRAAGGEARPTCPGRRPVLTC